MTRLGAHREVLVVRLRRSRRDMRAAGVLAPPRRTIATRFASTAIAPKPIPATNRSTQSRDPYIRAEGFWGLEMYDDATMNFAPPSRNRPTTRCIASAGAACFTSDSTIPTPTISSTKRLKMDPKNAQAYLGLALVSADGFDDKAIDYGTQGPGARSKTRGSARTDGQPALEDSDTEKATAEADEALQDFSGCARRHGHSCRH